MRYLFSLLALFGSIVSVSAAERKVAITQGITFAEVDGQALQLDLYRPTGVKNPPLVVFIHGGSWRAMSRRDCPMKWVAEKGYAFASIDYRFSQVAKFPAQIHDCKGAVRWLRAHAAEYGYDATRIAIAGASAGGHLAAIVGTTAGDKDLEGNTGGNLDQSSAVQAIVDFYGPADFVLRSKDQPGYTEKPGGGVYQLLGGSVTSDVERAKWASPAYHVSPDDPPLLFIHGSADPQVLPNQARRLAEAFAAAKVEHTLHFVEGAKHGGPEFDAPEVQTLVVEFLDRHLKAR